MDGQNSQAAQFSQTNVPDYQKMLQTSGSPDNGAVQTGWQEDVETVTPSPIIQHPQAPISPPMARRRFHHNFARESWDGGGGSGMRSGGGGGSQSQTYQPSKYGLVVEEMFRSGSRSYGQHAGYNVDDYHYSSNIGVGGGSSGGGGSVSGGGGSGQMMVSGASPTSSPSMMRRMMNRAPAENRRSYPDNTHTQQILEEYYDGYGSSSTAGGSTSGYGSGGGYDQPGNIRSVSERKSNEYPEDLGVPKPRSILRNSHSQSQLPTGRERMVVSSSMPSGSGHQEALQSQGNLKKSATDLRQWQQQHQEELLHQHIETQALYEKPTASLETMVRQMGIVEEDPTRWEPIRRAADNIIREKNMIIEKLRQRVLELEEDLKMTDNKLRQALIATDDKADIVQHKVKELQYKNASLKSELSETLTKKNAEINSLEEQLGAAEHELQQLKKQMKMKDADFGSLETKLLEKDKEVQEWGRRFQDMKTNHHQLRHKLDSVERYLADLPTAEETVQNTQEILKLKEEYSQNKQRADDLEQKLMQARKQLTVRDMQVKELEEQTEKFQEKVEELEGELRHMRQEDEAAQNLFRSQQELEQIRQDRERLVIDLEKAKKLLETTHRRLRQTETKLQTEITQLQERLAQEEEAVGVFRQEVIDKEKQVDKTKCLVKELGSQNQDLMEQNVILREQMKQIEQHSTDDGVRLQRRFMGELGLCFSELQSLVQVCLQRARGEDPNMSVLLGVRDAVADSDGPDKGAQGGEDKGQTIKQWLTKLGELRQEVDSLRASLCNQYAEDMGQNIQCATQ